MASALGSLGHRARSLEKVDRAFSFVNYNIFMTETESNQSTGEFVPSIPTPERAELTDAEKFNRDLNKINAVIENMLSADRPDRAAIRLAWAMRDDLAEEFIRSFESIPYHPEYPLRVHFELLIDKADIFERLRDKLHYLMELEGAEGFAHQYHLDDVLTDLGEEIDSKVGELDDSPDAIVIKLRGKLSYENRDFLHVLISEGIEMDDFIETIRQMVIKEEGDPDEVLASVGLR